MDSHERPRRAAGLQDVWTAFIPDLHQQRERKFSLIRNNERAFFLMKYKY